MRLLKAMAALSAELLMLAIEAGVNSFGRRPQRKKRI